jgi:hypothetical protein
MAYGLTPSASSLPRDRGSRLQLRPRTPWISPINRDLTRGILDFRSFRVELLAGLVLILMTLLLAVHAWADSSMNHETMDSGREGRS